MNGISGRENRVCDSIISLLPAECSYTVDALGNLHVFRQGRRPSKNKVICSAHMDEVGMIVTGIAPDGRLYISPVGGIDARVIPGRRVQVGDQNLSGVIGIEPACFSPAAERKNAMPMDQILVDIGAKDRADAAQYVAPGDSVHFIGTCTSLGNGGIKGKALDDRVGCAIALSLLQKQPAYDLTCMFVVQEEVGLRGAKAAAFSEEPDFAIVLETTTACDLFGIPEHEQVCQLGKGPVVSFMDRSTIYPQALYRLAFQTAQEAGIPCQTKTLVAGGNDAGAITQSRGGVPTLAISLPCRYLHSPSCLIRQDDLDNSCRLAELLFDKLAVL